MLEHFFKGFFGILGYLSAIVLTIVVYKLVTRKKAPCWAWERYVEYLILDEEFEEAQRLTAIIKNKDRHALIRTPRGYKVRRKKNLDLQDRYEEMTWVVSDSYVIKKTANKREKGFEIKDNS